MILTTASNYTKTCFDFVVAGAVAITDANGAVQTIAVVQTAIAGPITGRIIPATALVILGAEFAVVTPSAHGLAAYTALRPIFVAFAHMNATLRTSSVTFRTTGPQLVLIGLIDDAVTVIVIKVAVVTSFDRDPQIGVFGVFALPAAGAGAGG